MGRNMEEEIVDGHDLGRIRVPQKKIMYSCSVTVRDVSLSIHS